MRTIINWILSIGIIELFFICFVAVNVLTFTLYALDKRRAKGSKWRISENMLILFTLAFGGIGAVLGMCFARHKTKKMKFILTAVLGLTIAIVPLIHIVHSFTLDRIIRYKEMDFHSENWPAELDGYRIAFMTDMHDISDDDMRAVAAELNDRNLDLLLLGGDFSMRDGHHQGTLREIARISVTDGIFGVEGNHDNHTELFGAKERYGITPLDNGGMHVREGFFLAGVQDMWNRNPNVEKAIESAYAGDFILLISHNPDVSMEQSTEGIDLMLSGHTHGGQITLFGFPMYLLRGSITDHSTRFAYGFANSADGIPVFISSGVGPYYSVARIWSRPEVVIFTMYSGKG
jgi:hypothetical protein